MVLTDFSSLMVYLCHLRMSFHSGREVDTEHQVLQAAVLEVTRNACAMEEEGIL